MDLSPPAPSLPTADTMREDVERLRSIPSPQSNRSARPTASFGTGWMQGKKDTYNYYQLANLVGNQPGFAIVRRFADLNAKNILYMQAEISQLEIELEELEAADKQSQDVMHRRFQWEAYELMRAAPGQDMQWQKILEIRAKLKDYNTMLLQQQRLFSLPRPDPHDLTRLRQILDYEEYGGEWLEIPEDAWSLRYDGYLVALSVGGDLLERGLSDIIVPLFRSIYHIISPFIQLIRTIIQFISHNPEKKKESAERVERASHGNLDAVLRRIANACVVVVAALLPSLPVVALNYIHPTINRLLFTVAFSFVFSICLDVFTSGRRRIEVFVAVTALASIQVVYIGSDAT